MLNDSNELLPKPSSNASLLNILIAIAAAILFSYLIRYGTDYVAWRLAFTNADCAIFSLLLLGFPLALLVDKLLAWRRSPRSTRLIASLIVGGTLASLSLFGASDFELAVGVPAPPDAKILSSRTIESSAGGGEMYVYVQAQLSQVSFDQLLTSAGFTPAPPVDPEDAQLDVQSFARSSHFRLPFGQISNPLFYSKPWGVPNDGSTILWDPARGVAHIKRIAG